MTHYRPAPMPDLLATILVTTVLTTRGISTDISPPYATAALCETRAASEIQDARFRGERAIAGCVRPGDVFGMVRGRPAVSGR
jgi:hypothetical protein